MRGGRPFPHSRFKETHENKKIDVNRFPSRPNRGIVMKFFLIGQVSMEPGDGAG
jgi:hypothetical protein